MRPRKPHPYLTIILSFAGVIAVGTLLLLLPVSSASAKPVKPLTALFSATSAVCVTGLSVIDISAELSGFGQTVMALLMEIGADEGEAAAALLREAGFAEVQVFPDLAGRPRMVRGVRP